MGMSCSQALQTLEDKAVEGDGTPLLLTVLAGGGAAGISSPASPASSPAEIMEQRLSNRHPGLTAPGPIQLWSPYRVLAAQGLWGLEGWLGRGGCGSVQVGGYAPSFWRKGMEIQRNSAKPAAPSCMVV